MNGKKGEHVFFNYVFFFYVFNEAAITVCEDTVSNTYHHLFMGRDIKQYQQIQRDFITVA